MYTKIATCYGIWELEVSFPPEFKCRLLKLISVRFVVQYTEVNFTPWQITIYCCYTDCSLC